MEKQISRHFIMEAELSYQQGRHLAKWLKRVGFSDFERHARDTDEAYEMQEAAAVIRRALAASGFKTR